MGLRLSCAVLASVALIAILSTQTACHGQWGEPSAAEKKVLAALDSPTVCKFDKMPLNRVVEQLEKRHGVKMRVDLTAFEDFGLHWGTPVTLHAEGVSLSAGLRLILNPLEAGYVIEDDSLVITTLDEEFNTFLTRIHPIDDLLGSSKSQGEEMGGDKAKGHSTVDDCKILIEAIQTSVSVNSWVDVEGRCTIDYIPPGNPQSLVIFAPRHTHEFAQAFLGLLRRARSADPKEGPVSVGYEPESSVKKTSTSGPNVKKITAALKSPTSVNFEEVPLDEVLRSLGEKHGIAIVLDRRCMSERHLDCNSLISAKMDSSSLEDVLWSIFRELDPTYNIENGALMIRGPKAPRHNLELRVYPLAGVMPQGRRNIKAKERYAAELIRMLSEVVEPNSWVDVGGPASAAPMLLGEFDVLLVSQTPDAHEQIAGFLSRKEFRDAKWIRKKDVLPKMPAGGMGGGMF